MQIIATFLLLLLGCWGDNAYIIEGTVVSVTPPTQVVLDHKEVVGLMGPMVMPFEVADASLLKNIEPGHIVIARFEIGESGGQVTKLRVTGRTSPPKLVDFGPEPVRPGGRLPAVDVETRGGTVRIGEAGAQRVAVAFIYTRCPLPDYCPAVMLRLSQLERQLSGDSILLAITLDPAFDTLDVLDAFAVSHGESGGRIKLGRLSSDALTTLAIRAGMPVVRDGDEIVHALRLLVLEADGTLIERYDDNSWPVERVASQLATGEPRAGAGQ